MNTVIERWNLVCGPSEYLPKIAQTVFFCGNLVGVLICGWAADYFGRKPCIIISSILCIIGCVLGKICTYLGNGLNYNTYCQTISQICKVDKIMNDLYISFCLFLTE